MIPEYTVRFTEKLPCYNTVDHFRPILFLLQVNVILELLQSMLIIGHLKSGCLSIQMIGTPFNPQDVIT